MDTHSISEIRRVVEILHAGRPFELRCFHAQGQAPILSGYYDDLDKAAEHAAQGNSADYLVYTTLNQLRPDLLQDRPLNCLQAASKATREQDISRRRWLLIDVDAVRAVKDATATDREKAAARQIAVQVQKHLAGQGWPEPILADSGNGWHLLYQLDLTDSREIKQALKRLLRTLNDQFSTDRAKIDQSVFKSAQITKLYGTAVRKGADPTPERPHRASKIEYVPSQLQPVTLDQIRELIGPAPARPAAPTTAAASGGGWTVAAIDELLASRNIEFNRDDDFEDADGQPGARWVLPICPWNSEHDNGAAFLIRFASGAVAAGCHHDGCAGQDWASLKQALGLPGPVPEIIFPDDVEQQDAITAPVLASAAFHGLLGDIAHQTAQYSEASPAAILAHLLVMTGHVAGRRVYVPIGDSKHFLKLFLAVVGRTSVGRKGTALDAACNVFHLTVPDYGLLLRGGLSTGEGLIEQVGDPLIRTNKKGELEMVRDGVEDKRVLFLEAELTGVLQRFRREGNTLSQVLRDSWDDKILAVSTRTAPLRSTGSHICVIGHCTPYEIMANLRPVDIIGGLANRFLWVFTQRHQLLPNIVPTPEQVLQPLVARLQTVLDLPDGQQQIGMTQAAADRWESEYFRLAEAAESVDEREEGLLARAHAQVRRVAGVYAVADQSLAVDLVHLEAALAVVDHSQAVLQYLFRTYLKEQQPDLPANHPHVMAQRIRDRLAEGPMIRTEIRNLFHRHRTREEVDAALAYMAPELEQEQVTAGNGRTTVQYRLRRAEQ